MRNRLIQPKEYYDGAVPSSNAVAALNFLRLSRITGDIALKDKAQEQFRVFAGRISQNPFAGSFWLLAGMHYLYPASEVVIAGERREEDTEAMLKLINSEYRPDIQVIFRDAGEEAFWREIMPFSADMRSRQGKATAYVCENYTCQEPVSSLKDLKAILNRSKPKPFA